MNALAAIETRNRRSQLTCKVFTIKLDKSHLSKSKKTHLFMLPIEAKWLYNAQLSSPNIFTFLRNTRKTTNLDKDGNAIEHEIKYLSSQMIQALVDRTKQNIINLSKSKKKGNTVGKLKFRSCINSIPLTQNNVTYTIKNNKYIHIQGLKGDIKVEGLNQIPQNAELANASVIYRRSNIYIRITLFLPKEEKKLTGKVIGLDFGIETPIASSNHEKYHFSFPETKELKKASKHLNRCKKNSKNKYKAKLKLQKQYEKLTNQKGDARHKFIHEITTENDEVYIQNDGIHSWQDSKIKGFGRRIQHSIIGGIKNDLKSKSTTHMMPHNFPSTKLCPVCGCLNDKMSLLENRVYYCDCGYKEDRDIHSAINMLPTEHRNKMLSEGKPLTYISIFPNRSSFPVEERSLRLTESKYESLVF